MQGLNTSSISISLGGNGKKATLKGDKAVKHLSAFGGQPLGGGSAKTRYEDVLRAAEMAGVLGQFTAGDKIYSQMNPAAGMELAALKSFYGGAADNASKEYVHNWANEIRDQVGDKSKLGGTYVPISERGKQSSTSRYGYNRGGFGGSFRYNYKKDPTYLALLDAYTKNADMTAKNVLAHTAAMTGGAPSTYAVQAAQAASDAQMNELALQIPGLEAAAYNRWADQRDFAAQQQNKYLAELEARELRDYERRIAEEDRARKLSDADRGRAYEEAALRAQLTGDYSGYAALLGITPEEINAYMNPQPKVTYGGGSGSGSGTKGTANTPAKLSAEKSEMLTRYWENASTIDEFEDAITDQMALGNLTEQEYAIWEAAHEMAYADQWAKTIRKPRENKD